jgi:signal transduction histidine kinase
VKIFTQILQKHALNNADEKATQSLDKMDKQIDKLTDLILNMLNISKIQTGRMEFTEKEFIFDNMVQEVVEVLQQMTTRHKLIIVGKTNKTITGDEDRIGQVLSNLISNAIKYSPMADKVVITLTAKRNAIGVSVQDFGIGMAKKHLHKIFNRFYRVSGATDKTFPGLGIGLYISHEIVQRHGGKLWAESNPQLGSTFYLTLPLSQKENFKIQLVPPFQN